MAVEYLRGLCQQDGFAKGEFPVFGQPVSLADVMVPLAAIEVSLTSTIGITSLAGSAAVNAVSAVIFVSAISVYG
jgi:hypothetical protein